MIAEDLINYMIPPLKGTDDAHKAIVWMEEFRCSYMPVVENERLLGFISEEIILETNDIEQLVKDFNLVGANCFVHLDTHFYDILKVAADNKLQMVAVLNEDQKYAGVITVQDTLTSFAPNRGRTITGRYISVVHESCRLFIGRNSTTYRRESRKNFKQHCKGRPT